MTEGRTPPTVPLWPPRRGYVAAFLRAPAGWVLILALMGFTYLDSSVRAQNQIVCGAVSTMIDRQSFLGELDGVSRSQAQFMQTCRGFAVPDTLNVRGGLRAAVDGPDQVGP